MNRPYIALATYGTIAPGRPNHHQLDGLEGRWLAGQVNGMLVDACWSRLTCRLTGHVWTDQLREPPSWSGR